MQPNWIVLDGTANTRDVGGLPTQDGGHVAKHRLLRSDNLDDLSGADVELLIESYDVRAVLDLRTSRELSLAHDGPLTSDPRVSLAWLSLFPEPPGPVNPQLRGNERGYSGVYLRFLEERPDSVVAALRAIASSSGATLVHCTAGKDRTGVVIALALAETGVEAEAIIADYAASGDRAEALIARFEGASPQSREVARLAAVNHAPRPSIMRRFFDALEVEHGGVAHWLSEHGWTESDRAALRRRLTAN